ncbi:TRAP transporter substrate-binding protein [Paraliomyxa miuraensis]|uniref:TRAP transporter substrate-binding protein n=1 Tax=Paraliomyxa miuraensis TaxID=376150 RepID=UPI002259C048|nr:TRAP transporter substrate-binding protein DctP [Paraliomyxa miuraensis]MCX4240979.1 TRAP transporter substrate-binding protein DctP [Paraliomyxa miuraensis]
MTNATRKPLRRTFIKGSAAATAALATGFPLIAKAGPSFTIKMASLAPKGSSWAKAFEAVARMVKEESGGEMVVKTYLGGTMGDEPAMVRKVRTGQLDAVAVTNVGLGEIDKQLLMLQMPLLFKNYDQLDRVRKVMKPKFDALLASAGFIAGGDGDVGFAYLFSNSPIKVPSDVKNTKMWVWQSDPVSKEIMKVAGVNAVPLDVPDVLPSLQTGVIDAFANSPYGAIALQWYTKAAYITNLKLSMTIGGTVIGKKSWDALPPEFQKILQDASMSVHDKLLSRIRSDNKKAISALTDKGITVVEPEDFAAWKKVADTVRHNLTGSLFDKALVDEMMALI